MISKRYDSGKAFYHMVILAVTLLSLFFLLVGLAGLMNDGMPTPWNRSGLLVFFIFSVSVLTVLWIIAFRKPGFLNSAGLLATVLFCAGSVGLAPLLTVVCIGLSSLMLGKIIIGNLFVYDFDPRVHPPLEALVGLGTYATIVGLMTHYAINYPIVYALMLALPLIYSTAKTGDVIKQIFAALTNSRSQKNPALSSLIWYLFSIYLVTAAMPEISADGLAMHLMIPGYIESHHIWSFDPQSFVMALVPMNGDWLYALVYLLAGEYGTKFLNLGLLAIVAWLLWIIVERINKKPYGLLALVLFLSLPLTYLETGSLFVENTWAAFLLGAYISVIWYAKSGRKELIFITGLLGGFAVATKLTALLVLAPLGIVLFWNQLRIIKLKWHGRIYILSFVIFLAVGCIPYLTAYLQTGNPVFPFYNAIFKSPFFHTGANFSHPIFEKGLSVDVLYLMTFESWHYLEATAGSIGFYFLVLTPVAIITGIVSGNSVTRQTIFVWMVFFILLFSTASYLRYFYPVIVLVISTIVVAIAYWEASNPRIKLMFRWFISITVLLNLVFFSSANWNHRDFPLHTVFDKADRSEYITQRVPIRNAVKYLNSLPHQPSGVAFFCKPMIAGLEAKALSLSWYSTGFKRSIAAATGSAELASILNKYNMSMLVVDRNFISDKYKKLLPMLDEISVLKEKFGYAEVRSLRTDSVYSQERLSNPDFDSLDGWNISNGAKYFPDQNAVSVNVKTPITQRISVNPGDKFLLSVQAKCISGGKVRLQVNWLNMQGEFIHSDIDVISCSESLSSNEIVVVAPTGASAGVVYGTSHTQQNVELKRISLKQ